MLALAVVAFLLCVAVLSALAYVTVGPADRQVRVRRTVARPIPLPRPIPMPDLYAGRHRAVLIGAAR